MPHELTKITPNLVVASVERSIAFYRDILGFTVTMTVPEEGPHVFAAVSSGPIEVFFNAIASAVAEYPAFKDRPIGGTLTLFMEVVHIHEAYAALRDKVNIVMPLEKKWYGVTEFAFEDPDGYLLTYAEREV